MRISVLLIISLLCSCKYYNGKLPVIKPLEESTVVVQAKAALPVPAVPEPRTDTLTIKTGNTTPQELVAFAKTLIGVPYKYGSTDPVNGFDCSGFITYVFNHFNITVPRSSIDFTNYGEKVKLTDASTGDLILFTGTDSTIRDVGHMGIISSVKNNDVEFVHSTSGKANGVTITALNKYYLGRFVKVIRVL